MCEVGGHVCASDFEECVSEHQITSAKFKRLIDNCNDLRIRYQN